LIQEPPKNLPEELSCKHLQNMARARSSCKDLLERITRITLERNSAYLAESPQESEPVYTRTYNENA